MDLLLRWTFIIVYVQIYWDTEMDVTKEQETQNWVLSDKKNKMTGIEKNCI